MHSKIPSRFAVGVVAVALVGCADDPGADGPFAVAWRADASEANGVGADDAHATAYVTSRTELRAVDLDTGVDRWTVPAPMEWGYPHVLVSQRGRVTVINRFIECGVALFDPDGAEVQSYTLPGFDCGGAVLVPDGTVRISGWVDGRPVLATIDDDGVLGNFRFLDLGQAEGTSVAVNALATSRGTVFFAGRAVLDDVVQPWLAAVDEASAELRAAQVVPLPTDDGFVAVAASSTTIAALDSNGEEPRVRVFSRDLVGQGSAPVSARSEALAILTDDTICAGGTAVTCFASTEDGLTSTFTAPVRAEHVVALGDGGFLVQSNRITRYAPTR